ncbi:MAG: acyltransferase [Pelagimonas sp.]|jgi:peptidoglycan/LPS O-acetylase OafA/YrhL|nr:acyltransferase [Pelagimonas sp.]
MKYRSDIDGLRTVAVGSVCLAHAGISGFEGGFIGVDIFFVISGFLITRILIDETQEGRFSILRFYERRARRILPALGFLLFALFIFGYFYFPPWQYDLLAKSAGATMLFVSNMWFLFTLGGYFSSAAEYEPLLHTWSLAVEEQFYVLFPLLVWLLAPRGMRALVGAIVLVSVVSFVTSIWATAAYPFANFFLLPTRAWELGMGALLAAGAFPALRSERLAAATSVIGAGLIVGSIALLDAHSPFPGLTALPACLGAAALIHSGATFKTPVSRLLSTKPFVGIGLISYSLYLWHWPPLVFARTWQGDQTLSLPIAFACLGFAGVMAYISWRFVEQPWRAPVHKGGFRVKTVFAASGAVILVTLVAAFAVIRTEGVEQRLPGEVLAQYRAAALRGPTETACRKGTTPETMCLIGKTSVPGPADVFIWGDSHTGALMPGFDVWLKDSGRRAHAVVKNGCPALLDIEMPYLGVSHGCAAHNQSVLNSLRALPDVKTIVLSGRWAFPAEGNRWPGEHGAAAVLRDINKPDLTDNFSVFESGLRRSLTTFQDMEKEVILFEGTPEFGKDVSLLYMNDAFFGTDRPITIPRTSYDARNARVNALFDQLSDEGLIRFIKVADAMCPGQCVTRKDGTLLYRDDDHLSPAGAVHLLSTVMGR